MINDTSIAEYEEACAGPSAPCVCGDMPPGGVWPKGEEPPHGCPVHDPQAIQRAEDVMAALSGIDFQCDVTGQRIRPGDWVTRAVGGKGAASLRIGRVWPADKLTKTREGIKHRKGSAAPHLIIYELGGHREPKALVKATMSEGKHTVIIDKSRAPAAIRERLDKDRATLDAELKVDRDKYKKRLEEIRAANPPRPIEPTSPIYFGPYAYALARP